MTFAPASSETSLHMYQSTRHYIPHDRHYLFFRDYIAFEYFLGQQNFQEWRSSLLIIPLFPVEKQYSFTNVYLILDLATNNSSEKLSTQLFIKFNITSTSGKSRCLNLKNNEMQIKEMGKSEPGYLCTWWLSCGKNGLWTDLLFITWHKHSEWIHFWDTALYLRNVCVIIVKWF
jgi:hypothetical protein